jgi:CheY-like chemotaxis protein
MTPLRIVVLEGNDTRRHTLLSKLATNANDVVFGSADIEDSFGLCVSSPTDVLMCNISDDEMACTSLLRRIVQLPDIPAVSFHGCPDEIGIVEKSCLHLGLRYLGYLPHPIDEIRLARMLDLVRAYRNRVTS